jgi:hypothetical protein
VASAVVGATERIPTLKKYHGRWSDIISDAEGLFAAFAMGKEYSFGQPSTIETVAKCCQYLAVAEAFVRSGSFNPEFWWNAAVQKELLALDAIFQPGDMFTFRWACLLNPSFRASRYVGGADADLVVDDMLVDFKTTKYIGADSQHLRQLAGYVALHSMGGIPMDERGTFDCPIRRVAIYFARYGRLAVWNLEELFPGDSLKCFANAFRDAILAMHPPGKVRPFRPNF